MDTKTQVERILGVQPHEPVGPPPDPRAPLWDWASLGYPGVYSALVYLTEAGLRRWRRARTIKFPATCCACGAPAVAAVDFVPYLRLGPLCWRRRHAHARAIPHCATHAGRDPGALVVGYDLDTTWAAVLVVGRHRPFVDAVQLLNADDGDMLPPWRAFPGSVPHLHWNQGVNESWMCLGWQPFWRRLSAVQRGEYLMRWPAPEAWAVHLSTDARTTAYRREGVREP